MDGELFAEEYEAEERELKAAGWEPVPYAGGIGWMSPDRKMVCARDVALEMVRQGKMEQEG